MDARRALLEGLIDHAALFPPASMAMPDALAEDRRARESEHAWLLGRFVVPASRLSQLGAEDRALSVVADAPVVDERIEAFETSAIGDYDGEVYVEGAPLDEIAAAGRRAKVRCGGERIPSVEELAAFVRGCRERGLVFKATAGLHHAYPTDAGEHGFLNLLAAAVFGDEEHALRAAPGSFELDARSFRWDGREAGADELARVRTVSSTRSAAARSSSPSRSCARSRSCRERLRRLLDARGRPSRGLAGRRRGRRSLRARRRLRPAVAQRPDGARPRRVGGVARPGAHIRRPAARTCRATLHLPFEVADYVDFYSSLEHATNLGRLFRPDSEPLLPNWRWLPVGYHGRAGTVVVSGTDVRRPSGQLKQPGAEAPVFGPSQRLDIELELGFVVGVPSPLGEPVPPERFAEHVFGVVLVNDWSARDIQAWEYVPLGPFLGKSFQTSVSAWVTPLALLEECRVEAPEQEPAPLPYLAAGRDWALDIDLEVELNGEVISRGNARTLYWTMPQQLAHATSNGASLRTGDLMASGTISGSEPGSEGSLIELTRNTSFLADGDEVVLRGRGAEVELGEVRGRIAPHT